MQSLDIPLLAFPRTVADTYGPRPYSETATVHSLVSYTQYKYPLSCIERRWEVSPSPKGLAIQIPHMEKIIDWLRKRDLEGEELSTSCGSYMQTCQTPSPICWFEIQAVLCKSILPTYLLFA